MRSTKKFRIVEDVLARSMRSGPMLTSSEEEGKKRLKRISGSDLSDDELPCELIIEEEITLAQMQFQAKRKAQELKNKSSKVVKRKPSKENNVAKRGNDLVNKEGVGKWIDFNSSRVGTKPEGCMALMTVEDSDFHDFDMDRVEKSFRKGQIWAIYDDEDGMPRHYGLIDEAVSVNPFEVKLSWLDLQKDGDESLICWENMGLHLSCGKFKISGKTFIESVSIFSHIVECERVAREIYLIYPRKGSVWALYRELTVQAVSGNSGMGNRCAYDIVVCLTGYSEFYGLSMAYLEKVEGFKAVFKRKEFGCHAVKWVEKLELQLFSHEVKARRMLEGEIPNRSEDLWELDPASLPAELLTIASTE